MSRIWRQYGGTVAPEEACTEDLCTPGQKISAVRAWMLDELKRTSMFFRMLLCPKAVLLQIWRLFWGRGLGFSGVLVLCLDCFFAFIASLLFLPLCFSASLISCSFLPCFFATVLLRLSTCTILPFLFFSHVFLLLLYFLLLYFLSLRSLCFSIDFALFFAVGIFNETRGGA